MRTLAIIGTTLALAGVVVYWKRDSLEDWLSTFFADRIVHAMESPNTDAPSGGGGVAVDLERFGERLSFDTGRKVLATVNGATLAKRFVK